MAELFTRDCCDSCNIPYVIEKLRIEAGVDTDTNTDKITMTDMEIVAKAYTEVMANVNTDTLATKILQNMR
jgi:hypothetical protein